MARACKEWFPLGSFNRQREPGFYMDDKLKANLDILIKNMINDWDWTIIISGKGEVRTGKSVLSGQVACYVAYEMEKVHKKKIYFDREECKNWVFTGYDLISTGNWLGQNFQYSPVIYDEAGSSLQSRTTMQKATQDVLNYFRECGQWNLWNLLVLPDYFELPKSIAVTRSVFLIDVYYSSDSDGNFVRGFFKFYNRRKKKELYLKGRKDLNYDVVKPNFLGRFTNVHVMNEEVYRRKKREALKQREKTSSLEVKYREWLKGALKYIRDNLSLSFREMAQVISEKATFKISHEGIRRMIDENKGDVT